MKYPTQEEAQDILVAHVDIFSIGEYAGESKKWLSAKDKLRGIIHKEYERVFHSPKTSPWKISNQRGKRVIAWREGWGK